MDFPEGELKICVRICVTSNCKFKNKTERKDLREIKDLNLQRDISSEVDLVSDNIKASTREIDQALNK